MRPDIEAIRKRCEDPNSYSINDTDALALLDYIARLEAEVAALSSGFKQIAVLLDAATERREP